MDEMLAALNADEFVVFDTETTALGAALAYGKIIEIGAVKVRGNEIVETFSEFINPEMKIPKKITELTHITDEDVKDADTIFPVLERFKKFCGNDVLVGHNVSFDMRFLKFWCNQRCMSFNTNDVVVDTYQLDKVLSPDAENHKLCSVAERYNIVQEAAHRAIDDARVTALAFIEMRKQLKDDNLVYTYKCTKHCVNIDTLKYRRMSDFIKEGSKSKPGINRLYINLYSPDYQVYGSVYYDRQRKEWYNKDFPEDYEIDFTLLEQQVLAMRGGTL